MEREAILKKRMDGLGQQLFDVREGSPPSGFGPADQQGGKALAPGADNQTEQFKSYGHSKIDFPTFYFEDPLLWLVRANNYFEIYKTLEAKKVKFVSQYLDGDVIEWSQWLKRM
ncbi:hypothetical protein ACLOJK_024713 [Asimina triloba]